jgi:hypothetical protein
MSLVVVCVWLDPDDISLEDRLSKAVAVIKSPEVEEMFGSDWYYGGTSLKDSLSKPVNLDDAFKLEAWDEWCGPPPPPRGLTYTFGMWNGHEGASPRHGGVSAILVEEPVQYVHRLPGRSGRMVFDCPILDVFANDEARVGKFISFARFLASRLQGTAVVRSHELMEYTEERDDLDDNLVAYAAFWHEPMGMADPDTAESISEYVATTSWTKEIDESLIPRVLKLQHLLEALLKKGAAVPNP